MNARTISVRNFGCLLILFSISSIAIIGADNKSGIDMWISTLLSMAPVGLLLLLYTRLHLLFPKKNIFDIAAQVFGRKVGTVFNLLFSLYCILLATLSIYNYSNFMHLNSLHTTPYPIIGLAFVIPSLLLVKKGGHVLGNWGFFANIVVLGVMMALFICSFTQFNTRHLQPVGFTDLGILGQDALRFAIFPIAESVVLLGILDHLDTPNKPLRIFILPMLVVYVVLLLLFITTDRVLGVYMKDLMLFPSYKAMATIQIGFLERVEVFLAITYVLTAITKISCCLTAASKGAAKILSVENHQQFTVPIGFLILGFSVVIFQDIFEMIDHFAAYNYYAPFFQVFLPLILWIGAEAYHRKQKKLSPSRA